MSKKVYSFNVQSGSYIKHWDASDGGSEFLSIDISSDRIKAESVVVGGDPGKRYGIRYTLECQPDWAVRKVAIEAIGIGALHLSSDGEGNWLDGYGFLVPELDGCVDVDISVTPFTNTLPLRRLGLAKGERQEIEAVCLDAPSLSFARDRQAYTCIIPGEKYRYEGLLSKYVVNLTVDCLGIVAE